MKLYGLMVVQNEADVIQDTLAFLKNLNIYEAIFFYDLGSVDDTFTKAQEFKGILHNPQVLNELYSNQLRYDLLAKHADVYREGDWIAIIDADEFYVDDPRQLIERAESENANCLKTYQADFLFTDLDLRNLAQEDLDAPVFERRKHYLIRWSEERFYKFLPGREILSNSRPCSVKLLNRHYAYRSPQQIRKRIQTRLENKKRTRSLAGRSLWLQVYSADWKDYVVPHRILHRYDGSEFQFGIPKGVQWKDYYSKNPFSYGIPEIATALLLDKSGAEAEKSKSTFATHVQQEIRQHLSIGKWRSAAIGISVLIRFYYRIFIKTISLKYFCRRFRMKKFLHHCFTGLRRLLSGRSAGYITANPNPILLRDISEAGETKLSWRCLKTDAVEVHVGAPDGPLLSRSGSSGAAATGKWVLDHMVFFLQDVADQRPLTPENTIAQIPVVLLPAVYQVPPIHKSLKISNEQ